MIGIDYEYARTICWYVLKDYYYLNNLILNEFIKCASIDNLRFEISDPNQIGSGLNPDMIFENQNGEKVKIMRPLIRKLIDNSKTYFYVIPVTGAAANSFIPNINYFGYHINKVNYLFSYCSAEFTDEQIHLSPFLRNEILEKLDAFADLLYNINAILSSFDNFHLKLKILQLFTTNKNGSLDFLKLFEYVLKHIHNHNAFEDIPIKDTESHLSNILEYELHVPFSYLPNSTDQHLTEPQLADAIKMFNFFAQSYNQLPRQKRCVIYNALNEVAAKISSDSSIKYLNQYLN